ncbi:gas vesicle protein GvpG [Desulfocucumis palustris]|uniref:Gas vesicle protein GvpG n=1 Tax=Desulfocucumis palustris TaxID=1898651 RepID=A0A2L2X9Z9_9FIRM|nr:gas vesicle protein GvpG [Desulfocucumis palustris]GBF32443.1 gas vesicle protein GvpG [Desulfocucumis palustris]
MVLGKIFLSPFKGLWWVFEEIYWRVDEELYDEGKLQRQLLELRQSFELGDIGQEEYELGEELLIARLRTARERKLEQEENEGEVEDDGDDSI